MTFEDEEDLEACPEISKCQDEASPIANGKHPEAKEEHAEMLLEEDEEDDFEFEESPEDLPTTSYMGRMNTDFDIRKNYEEVILRILNFYQRSPQKHPTDSDDLPMRYRKSTDDQRKKTLFLDMDDLLISVSLFQHPSK